ncbi:uncharacterized protein LOC132952686 isoform X9 [Metopolophium dirhodum]|uniref:uncharacterized protein LOC132952686 isoform X8 n=1 Tax=Metopolophium dirhodum TaxID=44670 RepID=UPI00298FAE24|nr:uncharacterized protein LOC132952686 isoform X8 [Metopolophium dirhodum]XP_060881038.1 uncharacterized protein LOC132952686 isoform X9 [Metopolophium dirhodum]
MMIMLLIPRLLVAVAVMLIVIDVGVIARRWFSFGWWAKPSPYLGNSKPRSPYFQTTHVENIYRPYRPDLSSRIDSYGRIPSDNYNDDLNLSSWIDSYYGRKPSDKYNADSVISSWIDSYGRKPSNKYNNDLVLSSWIDSYGRKPSNKYNNDSDLSSRIDSYGRKPSDKYNDDSELQELMKSLEIYHQRSTPSAPVNQKLNTTSEQPQNPEVTTISTTITADTPLVDELQDSSTNLGKGLGLLFLSDPVKWEEPSTWNFTKTSRRTQFKTPGATVEHNLEEKKSQTTKNLGQPQLPAEN